MTEYIPLGKTGTYQAGSDGAGGEHGDPIVGRNCGALYVGIGKAEEPRTRMISYDLEQLLKLFNLHNSFPNVLICQFICYGFNLGCISIKLRNHQCMLKTITMPKKRLAFYLYLIEVFMSVLGPGKADCAVCIFI